MTTSPVEKNERTACTRKRVRGVAALSLSLAIALTGCAQGGTTSDSSEAPATSSEATTNSSETSEHLDLPAPGTIEGPSTAETVADIESIDDPDAPSLPATVTDYDGNEVTIDSADRILALDLYGTLSDIVTGLGLGDNLVGRTSSDLSEAMSDLPNVTTGGHNLNAEAILALNPTVVLADTTLGPPEVYDQLKAAGVTVVMFTPDRAIESNEEVMTDVAAALGVEENGKRLIERYRADMEDAEAHISTLVPENEDDKISAAVLYVRGTAGVFFIMGEESGAEEVVTHVGAIDAAAEAGIDGISPANAEALASLSPDVILMMSDGLESTGGVDGLLERPGVAETTAGQKQRIVDAPDGQLLSFGPKTPQSLESLAEAIYNPEQAQ